MQLTPEIYHHLLLSDESLSEEELKYYAEKCNQIKKLIDYTNSLDLMALFRVVLETKEKN